MRVHVIAVLSCICGADAFVVPHSAAFLTSMARLPTGLNNTYINYDNTPCCMRSRNVAISNGVDEQ